MLLRMAIILLTFLPITAFAQSMWGTGMWGGMQSCPYPTRAAAGATSIDDGTKEIQEAIKEAQQEIRDKKSDKKKADRAAEKSRTEISKSLNDPYAESVLAHIENFRRCNEYASQQPSADPTVTSQEGEHMIANANILPLQGFTSSEWNQVCDRSKSGSVNASICASPKYSAGKSNDSNCRKALSEFRKQYGESQKLQKDIEGLEEQVARYKEDLKDAKKEAAEMLKEQRLAKTEGGICVECMQQNSGYSAQKSETDWAGVAANIGTGVLATYMGYQNNKMTAEYNSNLGWPTQSYPSWSYGFPYIAAGLYGAMGGGTGQGSFGCGSGMGGTGNINGAMGMMGSMGTGSMYGSMGGAFGYPSGMMGNIAGGGMFNSGIGPWGMSGYGNMSGMGSIGGMGNMMGYGSMMGGMGNMVGYGSMMGGMGNMMGYGSMISGMGNMMGYGSMMGGMGNMMGYGSMMGGMDSYSMQYQQQMMQLQMQQYQTQMQYQQQYQQQSMQRYQVVSSLQQEMYSLMARIQSIQYGGTSSYIGSTGSLGSLGTTTTYGSSVISTLPSSTSVYSTLQGR
ncbi:hypothetical protein [Bdellovibrio reynosensis]|uniref:Uncharacterized protein n=1 Tax=Bdellovibrio reynosensis TaxID=2835041 RepID=A0ABY4C4R9_9BACT|nr:hypothetical protein [Bdellovibrio reynosensis]UOE99894.1 hypothetical protein MNR06_09310 [Bdellovibrio reynosensis]